MEYDGVKYNSIEEYAASLSPEERESHSYMIKVAQKRENNIAQNTKDSHAALGKLERAITGEKELYDGSDESLRNLNSTIEFMKKDNKAKALRDKGKPKFHIVKN